MAATFRAIANALVDAISALDLPASATVEAGFSIDADELMNADAIRVVVSPRGLDATNAAKRIAAREARVGIFVGGRAPLLEAQWAIADIAERIVLLLAEESLSAAVGEAIEGAASVGLSSLSVDLANEETLAERHVFRALIDATFKYMSS